MASEKICYCSCSVSILNFEQLVFISTSPSVVLMLEVNIHGNEELKILAFDLLANFQSGRTIHAVVVSLYSLFHFHNFVVIKI